MRSPWSFLPVLVVACAPTPAPTTLPPDPPPSPEAERANAPASAAPLELVDAPQPVPTAKPPETQPPPAPEPSARVEAAAPEATPGRGPVPPLPAFNAAIKAKPVKMLPAVPDDPAHGAFSLTDATKGLPPKGTLVADIDTTLGLITCRLLTGQAPRNVANFVGLARGLRPFNDPLTNRWTKRPAYDGTVFHRVIPNFMIQGGDPSGTGRGEPGYLVPDEVWAGGAHDRPGLLCAANRGPDTSGMQFFITDGAAAHIDNGFTIFGVCAPLQTIHEIASTPKDQSDRPRSAVMMKSIRIRREPLSGSGCRFSRPNGAFAPRLRLLAALRVNRVACSREMVANIESTLSYDALGSLVLYVNGDRAPDREEWRRYVAFLRGRGAEYHTVRLVVIAGSGAPDSVQRQLLTDSISAKQIRTAVVSDSVVARGVVTAFRWYGLEIDAFKSSAIEQAYRFVNATPTEALWLREAVAAARAETPRSAAR